MSADTQTQPKQKSSAGKIIGIGCLVVLLVAIVGGILLYQGVKGFVNKMVEEYTDTEPVELAAVDIPQADADALVARVKNFSDALEQGGELEPLELDSTEINYLITQNEDFAKIIRVNMQSNRLEGTVSAPLDKVSDMFKGRFLNGTAVFDVELEHGRLEVYADSITVNGEALPEQFMTQFRAENLAKDSNKNPEFMKFLQQLESISIEDGKLKIIPKTTPPPTPAKEDSKEDKPADEKPEAAKSKEEKPEPAKAN